MRTPFFRSPGQSAIFVAGHMFLAIILLGAVCIAVREHWNRLGNDEFAWRMLFWKWAAQGVGIPMFLWALINLGISNHFPAMVPSIAVAQAHDKVWWNLWVGAVIRGTAFTTLVWGAVTYSWMMLLIARRAGPSRDFTFTVAVVGIPMFLLALIIVNRSAWFMLPIGLLTMFVPLVHCTLHQAVIPEPIPSYSRAIGQINFGKYEDAEVEVINQLEKKENDFQGWMMLAELYATKYRRLEDAAQVVVDLCNDPTVQPVEISVACNKLADWQLELGMNPAAARAALDLLIQRAPDSHFAHMAEIRLKQLPRTREDLLDQKQRRSIRLPALREHFEEPVTAEQKAVNRRQATQEANLLTARLQHNPNDHETRERLAVVLAENLGHVKLAIEQLRLIIKMPENPPESRAKWLAHIANWERRFNKNEAAFVATLNEIIRDFPKTTQGYSARRQLQLLEYEAQEKARPPATPAEPIRLKVPEA
jgi:hypothetical protein